MQFYLLILIGIILIILGFWQLSSFMMSFSEKLMRLDNVLKSDRVQSLEKIEREVDELNYSYYEILNEIEERMSAIESESQKDSADAVALEDQSVALKKNIVEMINAGYSDSEIGKSLAIGSGEVAIMRTINHNREQK